MNDLIETQLALPSPVERFAYLSDANYRVDIKRDDLIHPHICGNKYRKLKYNLARAIKQEAQVLISCGGIFSNHLVAVAAAGHLLGIRTKGLIRGYRMDNNNPTIQILKSYKMELELVDPGLFDSVCKSHEDECALSSENFWIPMGGTNELALKGIIEGIEEVKDLASYDYIFCAVGTGGLLAGLIKACISKDINVVGVSPFKKAFDDLEIFNFLSNDERVDINIIPSVPLTRFGAWHSSIDECIKEVFSLTGVHLDPIYTAKVVLTIQDQIRRVLIPKDSKILIIHSGGLQGYAGYQYRYEKKKAIG